MGSGLFRDPNMMSNADRLQQYSRDPNETSRLASDILSQGMANPAPAPIQPPQQAPQQPLLSSVGVNPQQAPQAAPQAPMQASQAPPSLAGIGAQPPAPSAQPPAYTQEEMNPQQGPALAGIGDPSAPQQAAPQAQMETPVTQQDAEMKLTSPNERDRADLVMDDRFHSFITPNDPRAHDLMNQTSQYELMKGSDGGKLPISEDNGSVYQCPYTQTPCSRPSFFRRLGAILKKMFGIFDENQMAATIQSENLKDPIARQVLMNTGEMDKEVNEQLRQYMGEQQKTQGGMLGLGSAMPPQSPELQNMTTPPPQGAM